MPRKTLDIQQATGEVERHIDCANGAPAVEAAMCCDDGTEEIGHVGYPRSLSFCSSMALVLPAVDVNKCELCGTRLKMANCGAALIHSRLTDQPAWAARSAKDSVVNLWESSVCNRSPALNAKVCLAAFTI